MPFSFSDFKKAQQKFVTTRDPSIKNDPELDEFIIKKAKKMFDMGIKTINPDSSILSGKHCVLTPAFEYFGESGTFWCKDCEIDGVRVKPKYVRDHDGYIPFLEYKERLNETNKREVIKVDYLVAEHILTFNETPKYKRFEIRREDYVWRNTLWPHYDENGGIGIRPIYCLRQGPKEPHELMAKLYLEYAEHIGLDRWDYIQHLKEDTKERLYMVNGMIQQILTLLLEK